jgi:AcrR family transcriptional regulator
VTEQASGEVGRGSARRPGGRRVRRPAREARRLILEAAEKRLIEGGPEAVRVQLVAADLGLTDAAVHHHFGSREGLIETLLRFAGRRLREEIEEILAGWDGEPAGLRRIADRIARVYVDRGYARLALWLSLSGWTPRGSGMFEPLVDALHAARRARRGPGQGAPRRRESQHAVAWLQLTLVAEALFGGSALRSAGLEDTSETRLRFRRYVQGALEPLLLGA